MRIIRSNSIVLAFILGSLLHGNAQDPSASTASNSQISQLVRDPGAIVLLNAALVTLGGQSSIAGITDATVAGVSQAPDPAEPSETFVWQSSALNIRRDQSGPDGEDIFVVYQGNGLLFLPGAASQQIAPRSAATLFPFETPGIALLAYLNDPNRSVQLVSDPGAVPGNLHLRVWQPNVTSGYASATQQDWYFDPATALPTRVDFVLPSLKNPQLDGIVSVTYGNWQGESVVLMPSHMQVEFDGMPQATLTVSSVTFNQNLSSSIFQSR